jgi:small subunit ribosomal protein S16
MGRRNAPTYRIVVAESSMPRDGRIVESIGHYNPRTDPLTLAVNRERALYWLGNGATPTDTAHALLKRAGIFRPVPEGVDAVVATAAGSVKKAGGTVAAAARVAAAEVRETVAEAAEDVREAVAEVAEEAREVAAEVVEEVKETVAEVTEKVGDAVEAAREKVADLIESVTAGDDAGTDEESAKA